MSKALRGLFVLLLTLVGWSVAAQEVVVFKDFRALVVQSHRVDGAWTYLRVGAGEMAVPSAAILQVTQESGQLAAATPRPALASPPSPVVAPEKAVGGTPRMAPTARPAPDESDDEEDTSADEESDQEEAPPPPPQPARPGLPQSVMPRPTPFPNPAPVETKEKDD